MSRISGSNAEIASRQRRDDLFGLAEYFEDFLQEIVRVVDQRRFLLEGDVHAPVLWRIAAELIRGRRRLIELAEQDRVAWEKRMQDAGEQ